MDALCETILKICVLVSLGTMCQQILPDDAMRGYVRMACGLLILHIMLVQLGQWSGMEPAAAIESLLDTRSGR